MKPRYAVTRTFLGGAPGGGMMVRRTIVDRRMNFASVCVFKARMDKWTAADQQRFELVLEALNAEAGA